MDRVLAPSDNKREFYEKIGLVVFDRKIESIEDKEEALFLSNLTHLFGELERYTAFNEVNNETDEVAFNFELATSKGDFKSSRTYRLPKVKLAEVAEIENRIQTLLSGNDELDVCILLKMLNENCDKYGTTHIGYIRRQRQCSISHLPQEQISTNEIGVL